MSSLALFKHANSLLVYENIFGVLFFTSQKLNLKKKTEIVQEIYVSMVEWKFYSQNQAETIATKTMCYSSDMFYDDHIHMVTLVLDSINKSMVLYFIQKSTMTTVFWSRSSSNYLRLHWFINVVCVIKYYWQFHLISFFFQNRIFGRLTI